MLLQTNSYIVPREKRAEHARLLRRFRQTLLRLGCDHFEVYEQVGANWNTGETTGRFVQILRFRDRKHQLGVQGAERTDPIAQALVQEFCELINFPYQQQQGLFAVGFYTSFLRMPTQRTTSVVQAETSEPDGPTELPPLTPEPGVLDDAPEGDYRAVPAELEPIQEEVDFNASTDELEPVEPVAPSQPMASDETLESDDAPESVAPIAAGAAEELPDDDELESEDLSQATDGLISEDEILQGMSEEELLRAQAAIDDVEPAGESQDESEHHQARPAER